MLLSVEGHACLSDFGVAAQLRASNNYLTTGRAGTPGYMVSVSLRSSLSLLSPHFADLLCSLFLSCV